LFKGTDGRGSASRGVDVVTAVASRLAESRRPNKKIHMKAAGRAKRNRVTRLRREDGQVTQQKKEMESLARVFS
jgi:hypothetical protein